MTTLIAVLLAVLPAQHGNAALQPYRVDRDTSLIAFITHKGGIAATFVDNNLCYPGDYDIDLRVGDTLEQVRFEFSFEAQSLVVNDPDAQDRWYPLFHRLNILEKPFGRESESRRDRIKRIMVSEDQLDAERYPTIAARCLGVRSVPLLMGANVYMITLEVSMHGVTTTAEMPAFIRQNGDRLTVDIHGKLKFSDFEMKPYTRFFGAVRYRDAFDVVAHLEAVPASESSAGPEATDAP